MASSLLTAFAPVSDPEAKILILGSMPGIESLRRQQYYAHKRNFFWIFMAEILEFDVELPYEERLKQLNANHIALWDVFKHCERQGSLDSAIENPVPNDFQTFFAQHAKLEKILCNGEKSYRSFLKFESGLSKRFPVIRLPSTSPANASIPSSVKRQLWHNALTTKNGK